VEIPSPLIEQLTIGGRVVAPVLEGDIQQLVLLGKGAKGIQRDAICEVLYVSLRGVYGP
jgi:protein-L-isoaspartate(D-aspartate) O-methyltransferase